ncbi:MAG: M50 family metallopeptidase [Pirellulaceae bacterium]
MLIGEPNRTPYDINFMLFGFPIRISPWFWVATLVLGWGFIQGLANVVPGNMPVLREYIIWTTAVLISITIHELGHAFAFRIYGTDAHIVLYHFGGLAVPDSYAAYGRGRSSRSESHLIISAAGPMAQIAAALVLITVIVAIGSDVPVMGIAARILPVPVGNSLLESQPALFSFSLSFLHVSIYWALLNLIPVYPLDGGQIARELFLIFKASDAVRSSLMLSVAAAALVAVYAYRQGQPYLGIMFVMLGVSSYQALNPYGGHRW